MWYGWLVVLVEAQGKTRSVVRCKIKGFGAVRMCVCLGVTLLVKHDTA